MVNRLVLFFLGFLLFMPASALAACDCSNVREVFGEYTTVEVTRFRGGLTPREEAMDRVDKKILVSEDLFFLWDGVRYESPSYEMVCHPVTQDEGEVTPPSERRGDFYGFGMDRDVINVIYVNSLSEEGPRYHFEVVGDELWFFYDGWFYRMKRVSS
ncbi:hypothetical protein [Billgrantia antri]|uniref:Lipoprotein n=1 Tax=Billgrantia antri TaxID=2846777 RepID=A0ABS6ZR81_9GAMM|nr:hypothetical protein [Halomonas antri]MBW6392592.1 hypothetical protein [Halomonas antri]